jgi:hypothetical protein
MGMSFERVWRTLQKMKNVGRASARQMPFAVC